jgi:lipopolysaccharide biosynthesis protein
MIKRPSRTDHPPKRAAHVNSPSLLCIYAAYNIDDDDMDFIDKNCRDCDFIVIDSLNRPYLNGMRLENNPDVEYIQRDNIGYDVGAWKEYIIKHYEKIKQYEYLALINNSCRYDFKIRDALHDMLNKRATFYGLNISPVHNNHVQSYFTIIHKDIVNNRGFINHWIFMREIRGRDDAITGHELRFMENMVKIGAKVDTLTTYDFIGSGYEPERYNDKMGMLPPFMKKKLIRESGNRAKYERLLKKLPHMI